MLSRSLYLPFHIKIKQSLFKLGYLYFLLVFCGSGLHAEFKRFDYPFVHPLTDALDNAKRFRLDQDLYFKKLSNGEKSIDQMLELFFQAKHPKLNDDLFLFHQNDLFSFNLDPDPLARLSQEYDQHPICLYPASYLWLKSKLPYDFENMIVPYCESLDHFHEKYQPKSLAILLIQHEFSNDPYLRIKGKHQNFIVRYQPKSQDHRYYDYDIIEESLFLAQYQTSKYPIKILEYPLVMNSQENKLLLLYLWESKSQHFKENIFSHKTSRSIFRLIDIVKNSSLNLFRSYTILDDLDMIRILDRQQLLGNENELDLQLLISKSEGPALLSPKQNHLNQGHYSKQLELNMIYQSGQKTLDQGLSFALNAHQWADPQQGYSPYLLRSFFKFDLRWQEQKKLKLDRFTLVDYFHLKEITDISTLKWRALSWRIGGHVGDSVLCRSCQSAQGMVSLGGFTSLFQQRFSIWLAPDFQIEKNLANDRNDYLLSASFYLKWIASNKLLFTLQNRVFYDISDGRYIYQVVSQNRYSLRSWLSVQLSFALSSYDQKAWIGVGSYF